MKKKKLGSEDRNVLDNLERYCRIPGKLNYLSVTLKDMAFSLIVVSQFM